MSRQRNSEMWWRRTTATLLGVSFRRRCRDVLMDVMDMYHWDDLVMHHWDVVGYFILGFFHTSRRRTFGSSLLRLLGASSRCSNKASRIRTTETSWQRFIKTLLGASFETYQRRHWDAASDVATTYCCRLGSCP